MGGRLAETQEAVVAETAPDPDVLGDWRALARVLDHLGNDTPERRALLEAVGLEPGSLSGRICAALAGDVLTMIEEDYPGRTVLEYATLPCPSRDAGPPAAGLNTRRLSEIAATEVYWAWPGRIPLAKLTLIGGDPGVGKTWVLLDVIARLTSGRPFPDGTRHPWGRCDCLFATAEDGIADTIRPRVEMLGGDPSRVHVLDFVSEEGGKRQAALELDRHLDALEDYLARHPLVRLVGLDPLSAFMGRVDAHRNNEVRGVLGPLAKMAEKVGPGFVGINHLTKSETKALYRSIGSIAFNAAARAVWQVSEDPHDKGRSLLLPVKDNLPGFCRTGLAFRVSPPDDGGGGSPPSGISWEKYVVTMTADAALTAERGKAPARAEAEEMLRELLKDGPVSAADVWERAAADRLCRDTVKAAARQLGVRKDKTGGTGAPWVWSLPRTNRPLSPYPLYPL